MSEAQQRGKPQLWWAWRPVPTLWERGQCECGDHQSHIRSRSSRFRSTPPLRYGSIRRLGKAGVGRQISLIGLVRFPLDQIRKGIERTFVALRPQSANNTGRRQAYVRMMAKSLAPEDVREMHFDDRQLGGR